MALEKSWRWFGANDPIKLNWIRQMEVQGIVTSLHNVSVGEAWKSDEIATVKNKISSHGLKWNVVESLPVGEGIKTHSKEYDQLIENYILSMRALSENGINKICYNFMPVLDWVRTDLNYKLPSGGISMKFDYVLFAAFDIHILERPDAVKDYDEKTLSKAEEIFSNLSEEQQHQLAHNIIVVTQGFIHGNVKDSADFKSRFLSLLEKYSDIDRSQLRCNLKSFLDDILPFAEKYGIEMAIHPDDPPFSLLGLPRIASTTEDLDWIFNSNNSDSNGLTFCSGSLSVGGGDVCEIAELFAHRIKFVHLRNNKITGNRVFHESGHLEGIVEMPRLIKILLTEQVRRLKEGIEPSIPMRPDHGIAMLQDEFLNNNSGYPLYGRLKGLSELTGIEKIILDLGLNER